MISSPYLRLEEAAAYARAPESTVRYWISLGKLTAHKPGKFLLIHIDDLKAFIDGTSEGDSK